MAIQNKRLKISFLKIVLMLLLLQADGLLFAQSQVWEIDKIEKREKEKQRELDSLMVHLKGNWQVSLSCGQHYFNSLITTGGGTLLDFPTNVSSWNLSFSKYLSESIVVNADLGIHLKKIEPLRPDLSLLINGEDIEIAGGGVLFYPVSISLDYFFMQQRFRPYAGLGLGIVPGRFTYIEGSGSINYGFNRDEFTVKSTQPFVELSSGFIYRTGKNTQLGLSCDYVHSSQFDQIVGSYRAYTGITLSGIFSILF